MIFLRTPLLLLSISVCAALLLPALFMDGMFTDGIMYAAVSHNLAHGMGSFWDPFFSATEFPHFHEQPPLMFALQAGFFRIFGDSLYTERIYSLAAAVVNAVLIVRIWKVLFGDDSRFSQWWLPVLLWFIMPVTFWIFTNNVEECTMSAFDLAAALFALKALHREKNVTLNLVLAGVMLIGASMTKGFQGLFPLAVPFFYWLVFRRKSFWKMVLQSVIVVGIPALFYALILLDKNALSSYQHYFNDRLAHTFAHAHDTTKTHFLLLGEIFLNLPLPAGVALLLMFCGKNIRAAIAANAKMALFFALIALSATLPLMVTLEQRGFYIATGMPYFGIAFALFARAGAQKSAEALASRRKLSAVLSSFALLALAGTITITIMKAGQPKRDAAELHDIYYLGNNWKEPPTAFVSEEIYPNWSIHCYFERYFDISILCGPWYDLHNRTLITKKSETAPPGLVPLNKPLEAFNLYTAP